jgi:hypothetical protein
MAWNTPRTWSPGETVTAALMNAHLRDNLNVLKTYVDNDGSLRTLLKGFAYSAGQANAAGSGDTQLTSYDVLIPGGHLAQPGDEIVIEGTFAIANTTGTKAAKIKVAGGGLVTILAAGASLAQVVPFRIVVRRRTSTTGSATGIAWVGAASAGAPVNYLVNASLGTVNWAIDQTLAIFAIGAADGDTLLTDYDALSARGVLGSLV